MSDLGKGIKEGYQWEVKSQWKRDVLYNPIVVYATFFFGTKRRQDIDNFNKLWMDALSGIVWHDDSQVVEMRLFKEYDKDNPRIELKVFSFE